VSLYSFMEERGVPWHCLLMMGALFWLAGCATSGSQRGPSTSEPRFTSAQPLHADDGGGFGFLEDSRGEFQHLLMLFGSSAGTATRIGTTGTRLPVLSLTADGALAIERVIWGGGYPP
jgi:hypothetical protein